jgi:YesN/AraC family two-component response regulator
MDIYKVASFDYEIIESKKTPILHPEARFLFVNKGKGSFKINEREYEVRENMLIAVTPWDYTEIPRVEETFQYYLVVYNSFLINNAIKTTMNLEGEETDVFQTLVDHPVLYLEGETAKSVKRLFQKIRQETGIESTLELPKPQAYTKIFLTNLLVEVVIGFCRLACEETGKPEAIYEEEKKARVYKYIFTHLSEKLTLARLAKTFYLSESTISKYIMDTTGLTFNNLLNEIRMVKTMNYLLYTDYTLEEISVFLGYVDAAHISKVFEGRMGNKISEYRKTYQKVLKICNLKERRLGYDIVSYVVDNHKEELHARRVAEQFGISLTDLNRILLFHTERNFTDFLNYLRINSACELLVATELPLVDIAVEVGYNTVKTFTRNFVYYKQMNPSSYRKTVTLGD